MIATVADLRARGLADDRLTRLLRAGGWYLVGSRAAGFDDGFSDWDTVVLSSAEVSDENMLTDLADEIFDIERPRVVVPPTLDVHRRWRSAGAVDIKVLGPTACRRRELEAPAEWAFDLQHAIPLSAVSEDAERYRAGALERFERTRPELAADTYAAFRRYRNDAVATLARPDEAGQALTAAMCVAHAARFWLLADGAPHPAGKWLLLALRHREAPTLEAMAAAVDLRLRPADRFQALWQLWEAIDRHALQHRIHQTLLTGSPFL